VTTSADKLPAPARRAAVSGLVGTFIEYYDFGLYSVLTVYFAPVFFPSEDPVVSLIAGLAVFGVGFFARPLGGIIFGQIGDRYGRRPALISAIVMMGVLTGCVGLLPGYAVLGIWAPILLIVLRLGQGLSSGSEMLGSVTFVIESAPPRKRLLLASLTPLGANLGTAIGTSGAFLLAVIAGREWLAAGGWRVLFLLTLPLTVVALWLRTRIDDSPEFVRARAARRTVGVPAVEMFRRHGRTLLIAAGLAIATNGLGGLPLWFASYLIGLRGLPGDTVYAALSVALLVGSLAALGSGMLIQRFGQIRVAAVLLIALLAWSAPVMWVLGTQTAFWPLFLAILVFDCLSVALLPPMFSLISQMFPTEVRYTASNFGNNIGGMLGSGIGPLVATQLLVATGSVFGPVAWVAGLVTLGVVSSAIHTRFVVRDDHVREGAVAESP
jgi:MHS family proline/betaine transporter-like MFS transporter